MATELRLPDYAGYNIYVRLHRGGESDPGWHKPECEAGCWWEYERRRNGSTTFLMRTNFVCGHRDEHPVLDNNILDFGDGPRWTTRWVFLPGHVRRERRTRETSALIGFADIWRMVEAAGVRMVRPERMNDEERKQYALFQKVLVYADATRQAAPHIRRLRQPSASSTWRIHLARREKLAEVLSNRYEDADLRLLNLTDRIIAHPDENLTPQQIWDLWHDQKRARHTQEEKTDTSELLGW